MIRWITTHLSYTSLINNEYTKEAEEITLLKDEKTDERLRS